MNQKLLLASFTLLLASTSAMSMEGKDCEAKSAQMNLSERNAFMKTCLAQLSEPSNVKEMQQQGKRARCEQNSKNQNLQGNEKNNYVTSCMTANEAAAVAKATPSQTEGSAAPAEKPKTVSTHKGAKGAGGKPKTSCVKQANKKGLKGDARMQFLKDCKPG